ncbi:hypothetical protein [Rhodopila sp.]|uniref:hypothetical protein n=1 Tax=Rhodopila sp. TaxID=2480087 RepID=UPI003D136BA2
MMKNISITNRVIAWAFVGLCGLAPLSIAVAAPVQWTLSNGAFAQGGTFSGSFTYNADLSAGGTLTNWSIAVTPSTGFGAFTYTPSDSTWSVGGTCCNGSEIFDFTSNASGAAKRYFFLPFDSNLTDAGGTSQAIVNNPGNSSEVTNSFANDRDVSAGFATTVTRVPEPATLSLLSLPLLLLGMIVRRHRLALALSHRSQQIRPGQPRR